LNIDANILHVVMSMHSDDFIGIDQHSDGLRQFVALRAFVALFDTQVKPIVLIDEAETHLHYDAQADLVNVMEEQQEAAKVIYTTHSAGCLPRDLGIGIRAIVPIYEEQDGRPTQTDYSRVVNSFWEHGSDFSPLLIAMGASAFAFSATQRAAVTEGMSDALLLPTLIREATGEARLSYQVVPGFSEARAVDVRQFDLLAARVAFIADGDEGGRAHAQKLVDNGVRSQQIIYLGSGRASGVTLEDLLIKSVYVAAVNEVLGDAYPGVRGARITEGDIGDVERGQEVETFLASRRDANGRPLVVFKTGVAQRLLDRSPQQPLVAPRKRATVRALHQHLESVFETATHEL
jgi:predicted ATP-dependent endonuclease of OLD family